MKKKIKNKLVYISIAVLTVLIMITVFQAYQISVLFSEVRSLKMKDDSGAISRLQEILEDITPKGVPEYGEEAKVSYDDVEGSLVTLMKYSAIELASEEQERYSKIANTEGTACYYCCGATRLAQNCGCSHNIALQGLVRWLIKNTAYTNEQILEEVRKYQILFFPQPTLEEELQKRNINPEEIGLPTMRGGC